MEIIKRFDEDGINLNRESVIYDGMWWHRYPNAKGRSVRVYFIKMISKKLIYLHRYIWEQHNGKQPKGYEIHHMDDNPANNNIDNLILLTRAEHGKITWTGKKHSEETKLKMSIAGKVKMFSKEHKTKISIANTGKKQSAETIAKRVAGIKNTCAKRKLIQAQPLP